MHQPASPFTSEWLIKHEIWIMPLLVLCGLQNTNRSRIDGYKIAAQFSTNEDHYEEIVKELGRYASYVDSKNPDLFLAILTNGVEHYDEPEGLQFFCDDHWKSMEKHGLDEFSISKALYLGRIGQDTPRTFPETISAMLEEKPTTSKRNLIENYINCLAKVSEYEPQQVASMLAVGGYTLKK